MSKIIIKTNEEIDGMREAGQCAAFVLNEVKQRVAVGVSTWDLDLSSSLLVLSVQRMVMVIRKILTLLIFVFQSMMRWCMASVVVM